MIRRILAAAAAVCLAGLRVPLLAACSGSAGSAAAFEVAR
jgi:hypothetical protein